MSATQFLEWETYAALEPFGELREDYRNAAILQMLYNINRGKDQKAMTLDEMRLKFGEQDAPKRTQGPKEHAAFLRMLAAAHSVKGVDV